MGIVDAQRKKKRKAPVKDEEQWVVEDRRERNRISAKKSRLRKKFYLKSLQEEVKQLRKRNKELEQRQQKAVSRNPSNQDPPNNLQSFSVRFSREMRKAAKNHGPNSVSRTDKLLVSTLKCLSGQAFCVTNPFVKGNPIIHCNTNFFKLTGYSPAEVINRNCRFLQGPRTCPKSIAEISEKLSREEDVEIVMLNYKKDKSPFWNHLYITGTWDENDQLINYIGIQEEIDDKAASEWFKRPVDKNTFLMDKKH